MSRNFLPAVLAIGIGVFTGTCWPGFSQHGQQWLDLMLTSISPQATTPFNQLSSSSRSRGHMVDDFLHPTAPEMLQPRVAPRPLRSPLLPIPGPMVTAASDVHQV